MKTSQSSISRELVIYGQGLLNMSNRRIFAPAELVGGVKPHHAATPQATAWRSDGPVAVPRYSLWPALMLWSFKARFREVDPPSPRAMADRGLRASSRVRPKAFYAVACFAVEPMPTGHFPRSLLTVLSRKCAPTDPAAAASAKASTSCGCADSWAIWL